MLAYLSMTELPRGIKPVHESDLCVDPSHYFAHHPCEK